MSWTGKVVSKVGHYFSLSSDNPLREGCAQDTPKDFRHWGFTSTAKDSLNASCRPDTSRLASFLFYLRSSPNPINNGSHVSSEVSVEAPCSSTSGTVTEPCERHGKNKEQKQILCTKLFGEDSEENNKIDKSSDFPHDSVLQSPAKLPPMSDDSILLFEDLRTSIYSALPTVVKDRHWIMLYSTSRHGISMRTLYQKSSLLSEPYLLVVRDRNGATFGGLATAPLKPAAQRKYVGTNDTFVFTTLGKDFELYKATGINRYYLLCTNDAISFGGGGHFAIHLDESLLTGSSGSCDTFGNDCLANSFEFSVSQLEVWGFAHTFKQPHID